MSWHIGPGPVFRVEMIAAARRWQTYALRAALIAVLLCSLIVVWASDRRFSRTNSRLTLNEYAAIGTEFTNAILGTQLALVLLAAPAATAGAICIDKARGNLFLLMASDISSREIVLGKLFGCLMPVFGLIVASLPVLFIASLLGGVAWQMVLGGFITIVGAALLGCAIALVISLYVGKTHEALLLAYLFTAAWLLSYPIAWALTAGPFMRPPPDWLLYLNPFVLLFAPANPRSQISIDHYMVYVAVTLGLAAIVSLLAAWRLRTVVLHQAGESSTTKRATSDRTRRRSERLLSRAPMSWYERHRKRPSRATKLVWAIFTLAATAGTGWTIVLILTRSRMSEMGIVVNLLQIGFGLLLVSVFAVSSLADERARGSLDVLMTTPVASRSILSAKWRSTFALVPRLLILPAATAFVLLLVSPSWRPSSASTPLDGSLIVSACLLLLHPLACGAMLTSMGLFFATWLSKFGRAVGTAIGCYVMLAIGWIFFVTMVSNKNESSVFALQASPVAAQAFMSVSLFEHGRGDQVLAGQLGAALAIVIYLVAATVFYRLTVRIFDRRMGRIPDQGLRRQPDPPNWAAISSSEIENHGSVTSLG